MRLKKIILENIRSYEYQEIEFGEGSILLSGDIGSGKTSILLGIEFALFGLQPGQRGSSLLRNQAQEGRIILELKLENKEIIIERTLTRGKTITQNYCAITIDGERKEMSVSELKNKILELLNYPSEFSKKQNLLYKFTVYTPQEEMKQIILEDPETRINTLRHVFGIDKYKKILENISILTLKLREEKRIKEALISNLEQDKIELSIKEKELENKQNSSDLFEKELLNKQEIRGKLQDEKQEVSKKIEEKTRFQQEIEKTKILISSKNESAIDNLKLIEQIKKQIKELQNFKFDESEILKIEKELVFFAEEKEKLEKKKLEIASKIFSLNSKNEEIEKISHGISNLKICPTCLQDVDAIYKANVLNKLHSDNFKNNQEIEKFEAEKKVFIEKLLELGAQISLKNKKLQERNIAKIRYQEVNEKQKRLEDAEKLKISLERDIEILSGQINLLKSSVFDLSKFDLIFEHKQKEFEEASKQERLIEIKVAETKREIEVFSKQVKETKEKLRKTEDIKKQLEKIVGIEGWLSKEFYSVIFQIEKNVMIRLKADFSKLFAEWFYVLVPGFFNATLDDDFTPIIEQHDYEIDYAYLSGGERTAIALAYRLALNQVINSLVSKIKTRDLVILDEPTDGFSEQQLDKMRDVLQELNVKQLIIVSHEQKIEGFVENVVRLKKEGGISKKENKENAKS